MSSSSDKDEREIDEYHNESNSSGSSSESNSADEQYSSRVPGVPLEVLREEMRRRAVSRSSTSPSTNVEPFIPSPREEVDIIYSCIVNYPSRVDEKGLVMLRDKYQIPDKVNPCFATLGE